MIGCKEVPVGVLKVIRNSLILIRIYNIGSSSECVGPVKLSFPVMTPLDRHVGLENSQIFVDTRKSSANFHAEQSLKVSFQGNENSFSF